MNQFRNLRADEIDVRVATCSEKGCSLLLYKDARVDQNILDETFGIYGWERTHQLIGDRLYCTVKVKNPETGEWISKQDVGTESNTEKEKGQASDSFKRSIWESGGNCTLRLLSGLRLTSLNWLKIHPESPPPMIVSR